MYTEIEGQKYLTWLVERILDTIGNPAPDRQLISRGGKQSSLFESLIKLGVIIIEPVPNSYDHYRPGPNYGSWVRANTTLTAA